MCLILYNLKQVNAGFEKVPQIIHGCWKVKLKYLLTSKRMLRGVEQDSSEGIAWNHDMKRRETVVL